MRHNKFIITLITILSILMLAIPFSVSAADQAKYPAIIGELPVIYVHTPENTIGLSKGEAILTLFDKNLILDEQSIVKTRAGVHEYLAKNPLPDGYSISIYGGPGASKELYEKTSKEIFDYQKIHVTIQLAMIPSHPMKTNYAYTFATVQNKDPYYSNSVTFQSAYWYSPTVGTNQNHYSALLVNGVTDNWNFLQAGQAYHSDGTGLNVYSDTMVAQTFSGVAYGAGHNCKFAVGYLGIGNGWFMSVTDYTSQLYQEYDDSSVGGNHLVTNENTNVWLENWNTNSAWYSGFSQYDSSSNYLKVRNAYDVDNGTYSTWDYERLFTIDNQGNYLYDANQNVITGSLVSGSSANWYLPNVFLGY